LKTVAYIVDPTLGHVARAHEIAKHLCALTDIKIAFITPDERNYVRQILGDKYETYHVGMHKVRDRLFSNRFAPELEQVLDRLRPDLIVHDLCPLRYLSTVRFPDCPRVHVTNAFLTGPAGKDTYQTRWFKDIGPAINTTRAEKGLTPLRSAHQVYEADRVLCADPQFVADALLPLPAHYTVCGHIGFEVQAPVPDQLCNARDLMIMSMGSTGPSEFSADLLRALKAQSGSGSIIYVGRPVPQLAELRLLDGIYEWLPTHRLLDRARIVVTQGGTGSSYQALAHGRPVAVLPLHRNHEILGQILQEIGVGIMCCGEEAEAAARTMDFDAIAQTAASRAAEPATIPNGAEVAAHQIAILL